MSQVLDDFNDGSLSEYSGDTSHWNVDGNFKYEGAYSGRTWGYVGTLSSIYRSTPAVAPECTVTFAYHINVMSIQDSEAGFLFGRQDGNHYYAATVRNSHNVEPYGTRICLYKDGVLQTSALCDGHQIEWYEYTVEWKANGTIKFTWPGAGQFHPAVTVQMVDTDYTSGDWGWFRNDTWESDHADCWVDYAILYPAITVSGSLTAEGSLTGYVVATRDVSGGIDAEASLEGAVGIINWASGTILAQSELTGGVTALRDVSGTIDAAASFTRAHPLRFWIPCVEMPTLTSTKRRLTWPNTENAYLMLDGAVYLEVAGGQVDIDASVEIREYLVVMDGIPDEAQTPLDRVRLSWTDEQADHYDVWRGQDEGGWLKWARIASVNGLEYTDGPLVDGVYDYRVVSVDAQGNEAESLSVQVTISSAPEPPTNLTITFSPGPPPVIVDVSGAIDGTFCMTGHARVVLSGVLDFKAFAWEVFGEGALDIKSYTWAWEEA
jgi:hypothetical protein